MRGLTVCVAIGDQNYCARRRAYMGCASGTALETTHGSPYTFGQEHVVGDGGDLFGVAPGALELSEIALERAALRVLVQRHLERDAINRGQAEEARVVRLGLPAVPAPHLLPRTRDDVRGSGE